MNARAIEQLFRELAAKDIHLRLIDGNLRVNAPRAGMPAELRAELSARKQEIIDFLTAARSDGDGSRPELLASTGDSPAPLSFGQERIWILHELTREQASPYDTLVFNLRLQGRLNLPALRHGLSQILRRHQILRTVIDYHGDQPMQKVVDFEPMELPLEELEINAGEQPEQAVERLLAGAQQTLLDPATGPLFQVRLIKLDDADHLLLFVLHHMIFDAWSLGVLTGELVQFYAASLRGEAQPLPELPVQYGDFARWQRQWLQGAELQRHLKYWREQLDGISTLDLPLDRPRSPVQTYNGANQSLFIPEKIAGRLAKLGQQNDASLFMTMLTTLGLFLSRYSGQTDVAIGTPITSRDRNELQGLIGFFLNTLVLRLDYSGEADFFELLRRNRQTCLDAFAHQHLPFEKLVEELQPERDQSKSPLFQVMFWLKGNPDASPLELPDLRIGSIAHTGTTTRFDLDVTVIEAGDGFHISFTYNTDLFDEHSIDRMLKHYATLLESIAGHPAQAGFSLPIMGREERSAILEEPNRTQRDYVLETTLPALFEAQVDRTPDNIALGFESESLTYRELDQRANQLAHYLRDQGIGVGDIVGVFMQRSLEMVIALYAIHKAGAAYLPLDTDYPASRLDWMIEDTRTRLILTQSDLAEHLPAQDAELLYLNGDNWQTNLERHARTRLALTAGPEDGAYVIFTSGSTGKPKGVVNAHRGLVNLLLAMQERFGLTASDCDLQKTPYSFDVSVLELFWPLANGARLVVARPEGHKDPAYLSAIVKDRGVTTLHFVPSMLRAFIDSGAMQSVTSLRRVICIGEALPPELQQQFYAQSEAELWNLYGPTEAAVVVSSWLCRRDDERPLVPIGYPLSNTRLYVLDAHGEPVPRGVAGELHIGGEQVARGYLNRPELTAERFIADPFSDRAGARLYRSGDRARYLEDGSIEFLGRIDTQVKLRGHRIELGEIESLLADFDTVTAAVAVIREDNPQSPQLVAYVTGPEPETFDAERLKDYLAEHTPQYMLPSQILLLAEIPLTANGKLDRKRLPAPRAGGPDDERELVLPRNESERQVAAILQDLLGVETIGVHDNFFMLGGHSLLAIRAVTRINQSLGTSLSFARFMTLATVASVAAQVGESEASDDAVEVVRLQALVDVSRDGEAYPLTPAQERLWYIDTLYPEVAAYNVQLHVTVGGGGERIRQALELIQQRHAILRTTYRLQDEQPVQVIHAELPLSIEYLDTGGATQAEVEQTILSQFQADGGRAFNLETGPVWRCSVLEQSAQHADLLITIHHIATDGWSLGLLKQEIVRLCRPSPTADVLEEVKPGIQYIDYVLWQREQLQDSRMDSLLDYWSKKLAGLPDATELPADKPRPPIFSHAGAYEIVTLGKGLSDELRRFARQNSSSLYMLMLAVFKLMLSRYARQADIVVGTPVTGRNLDEMSGILGLFVNMLVLRSDLSASQSFSALLRHVRENSLQAFAHQELPFEKVVEILQPERDLSRNPVYQVMYNFFAQEEPGTEPQNPAALPEEAISSEAAGTLVDLTFLVKEDVNQISIGFEYYTDLFESATIRRMLTHYRNLLSDILEDPQRKLSEYQMLGVEEREQMLIEWNATAADYPADKSLSELFEDRVATHAAAQALVCDDHQLSYGELNLHANRLAHYLRGQGVVTGTIIGICIDPGADMIVALLAVLKAGGAYLPLDPAYPAERLRFMIEDSGAGILIGGTNLPAAIGSADILVMNLEREAGTIAAFSDANLPAVAGADDLAYVIYTSGSTGKPKGVKGLHRGAVNRLAWMRDAYPYAEDERCCQKTTLSFVDAVAEIFSPLLAGLSLVVVTQDKARDAQALAQEIASAGVTRLVLVPSLLRTLLDLDESTLQGLRCVRHWVTSGERLEPKLELEFRARFPDAVLLNLYGSSEVSADVTFFNTAERGGRTGSLIGRPIANTRAYVLDEWMNPVPVGVPGELHVGGAGLARGYLGQAELTAERFVADPFAAEPDARLYKTGDLVRYQADGIIEYLGRIDQQVKVRGFRIETGEVEAALAAHDCVREAVVIVDQSGERLLAYIVTETDAPVDEDALREHLQLTLPAYMLPSLFMALEALPLTANGKLDRKRLPAPRAGGLDDERELVLPRNESERQVAAILQDLLGVETIGVHDNFFRLGGHSLLAIRAVNRINQALESSLTFAQFMSLATVEQIAAHVETSDPAAHGARLQALVDVSRDGEAYPLTPAQERLWYIDTLYPEVAAYNLQLHVVVDGGGERIRQALELIQQRHAILRTTYRLQDEQPVQVIHAELPLSIEYLDTGGATQAEVGQIILSQFQADGGRAFNLETGPVWRCSVLEHDRQHSDLLITIHHIATDGWSMNLLQQEILQLCQMSDPAIDGSGLPPVIQYVDYSLWQQEQQDQARLEQLQAYWTRTLADAPPAIELPTDRPRPPVYSYAGAIEYFALSEDLTGELRAFSRSREVSLFMLLLAAFKLLLSRYAQQDDLVVGTPVSGRSLPEMEPVVGIFVNTLLLRSRLQASTSFDDLLSQLRDVVLQGFEHQELAFEKIVELLQPERDLSRNPLFQVLFSFLPPQEGVAGKRHELSEEIESSAAAGAQVDLSLVVKDDGDQLLVAMVYNTDLFAAATIRQMLEHYRRLLDACIATPAIEIGRVELLSAAERSAILEEPNRTQRDYALETTLPALFEAQVDRTPDSLALTYEHASLTYRELDQRANQLAHYLRDQGIGVGDIVGVFMQRSLEMVIALYAIHKAGAAYLPLDTDYPASRLDWMIEDTRTRLILTQSDLAEHLPAQDAELLYLNGDNWQTNLERHARTRLALTAGPEDGAYVIFTSGSTGKPKGVVNAHRGLVNLLLAMQERFGLTASDCDLQKTPYSFDVSVLELFWPLANGARLVVARPEGHKDPAYLSAIVKDRGVTTLHFVPSMLRAFIDSGAMQSVTSLRRVICIGEALPPELQQQFYAQSEAELWNLYGPTEAAVVVSSWLCRRDDERPLVPIGYPLSNTRLYVLDAHGEPVPRGVAGELHIGGEQVARGYLNRPELTAERFIADPFSDRAGARLYRSGDRARYLEDGSIEFLGRIDTQVKLRGHRIELGEIESLLADFDTVTAAVAVIREDNPQSPQLVAYVTGPEPETFDAERLKDYLAEHTPQYMLPSQILLLAEIPLTANGKLDRKRLPAPRAGGPDDERELVLPRNESERQVAAILQDLLGVETIGVHDNFFMLGGHSLLAIRAVTRINQSLGTSLSFARFMTLATVASVAAQVGESEASDDAVEVVRLQALVDVSRDGEAYPLTPAQERLWYIDTLYPEVAAYNVQLHVTVGGGGERIRQALELIQQRHAILRTTYRLQDEQPVQVIHAELPLSIEYLDTGGATQAEVEQTILSQFQADGGRAFNLETGPVWRCSVLEQSAQHADLLITIHHIATDGWSMNLLKRELEKLCRSKDIESVELAAVIQYVDYSLWQQKRLDRARLEQLQDYWTGVLAGAPPSIELPTDRPRPPVYSYAGAVEYVALSEDLTGELRVFSRSRHVTLFMSMLAAFKLLLSRYAQQDELVVGTPVSGRTTPETEDIVGAFVNTLLLRCRLSADDRFTDLLLRVRDLVLQAFEHQELAFEKIVELLQPQRDLSRNPLFQVMFNFLVPEDSDAGESRPRSRDLSEEIESSAAAGAQVDLTLVVKDDGDQLLVAMVYNTDLFAAATIRQMLEHYRRLLGACIATPAIEIGRVELLSAAERSAILEEPNRTQRDYVLETTLPALFEAQVDRTPDNIALGFESESLTYRELDQRANQLAHYLRDQGIGVGDIVGVFMQRSLEMVIALYAIHKAGAAYLPLDTDYPASRLDWMIEDTRTRLILTQSDLAEHLPAQDAELLYLNGDNWQTNLERHARTRLALTAGPEDGAYVIFTSGSTGKPKGVVNAHRGLVNLLLAMQERFGLTASDCDLQKTPYSFDVSVLELFWPLANGARLVVARPEGHKDPAYLSAIVKDRGVTTLHFVPSMLRAFIDSGAMQSVTSLRRVICIGEALPPELQQQFYAQSEAELWNLYGPTEAAVVVSSWLCRRDDERPLVPIGYPLSNTRLYVLDAHGEPVPRGVAGELHIGGEQVARGYLNRPELTAERFIADPFSDRAGARLYRSGDRARYLEDGSIEFLGRIDTQVKLRGHRIELGEIESLLQEHERIANAAVLVREDEPGDQRLVAYLILKPAADIDAAELTVEIQDYLRKHLPAYMVPAHIETMNQFPLLPNGKLNSAELPRPQRLQKQGRMASSEPTTDMEIILAGIWEELLDIDDIETDDTFFDLGGHSLLTLKVVDRFARETGIRISPISLINQTLRQLAASAEKTLKETGAGEPASSGQKRKIKT